MLIDQIKPEILVSLNKDYEKYNTSVNHIYNVLATKEVYSQLTINELSEIIMFSELNLSEWNSTDILFGDKLLINNN